MSKRMAPRLQAQQPSPRMVAVGVLASVFLFIQGCRLIYLGATTESGIASVGFGLIAIGVAGYSVGRLIVWAVERHDARQAQSQRIDDGPTGRPPVRNRR